MTAALRAVAMVCGSSLLLVPVMISPWRLVPSLVVWLVVTGIGWAVAGAAARTGTTGPEGFSHPLSPAWVSWVKVVGFTAGTTCFTVVVTDLAMAGISTPGDWTGVLLTVGAVVLAAGFALAAPALGPRGSLVRAGATVALAIAIASSAAAHGVLADPSARLSDAWFMLPPLIAVVGWEGVPAVARSPRARRWIAALVAAVFCLVTALQAAVTGRSDGVGQDLSGTDRLLCGALGLLLLTFVSTNLGATTRYAQHGRPAGSSRSTLVVLAVVVAVGAVVVQRLDAAPVQLLTICGVCTVAIYSELALRALRPTTPTTSHSQEAIST